MTLIAHSLGLLESRQGELLCRTHTAENTTTLSAVVLPEPDRELGLTVLAAGHGLVLNPGEAGQLL